jgi:hypothetical protein
LGNAAALEMLLLISHDLGHALHARNFGHQPRAEGRVPQKLLQLALGQGLALFHLVDERVGQGDEPDHGEHGRVLGLPGARVAQAFAEPADERQNARHPAENLGLDQGDEVAEHGHAAGEGLFQQLALGGHQVVVAEGVVEHLFDGFRRAGLGEQAEDVALVHGLDGDLQVRVAGQEHAHGVRAAVADDAQHVHAVHAGHVVVANDHGERALPGRGLDARLGALGGHDLALFAQLPAEALQQVQVVVDKQHLSVHLPSPPRPMTSTAFFQAA